MTPSFRGLSSHSHHHLRGQLGFQEGVSPRLGGFTSCSHLVRGQLGSLRVHDPLILGALLSLSPPSERPVRLSRGCSPQLGGFTSCSHLMRGRLGSSRVHDPPTGGALPLLSTYSNILGALMFEGWASQESVSLPIAGLPSCSPPDNSKCRG